MIDKLAGENNKNYEAMCDYWRLGPGRSIAQLYKQYSQQENPVAKSYATLHKWSRKFFWGQRITDYLESQQKYIEQLYREEQIELTKKQFSLLKDLHSIIEDCDVDTEEVTVSQYTNAIKTALTEFRNIFDLNPVAKIAPVTPDGKLPYNPGDVSELMRLADSAKRRPD